MPESIEFWRRWHLTLADFLRDYIYVPLVRSKRVSADGALFCTMLLSGFWHGASFAYIFFGLYFAVLMVAERRLGLVTKIGGPYKWWRNLLALIFVVGVMPLHHRRHGGRAHRPRHARLQRHRLAGGICWRPRR